MDFNLFFYLNYYLKYFYFWFAKLSELMAESKNCPFEGLFTGILYVEHEDLMFVKLTVNYNISRRIVYVTYCL